VDVSMEMLYPTKKIINCSHLTSISNLEFETTFSKKKLIRAELRVEFSARGLGCVVDIRRVSFP
jgi:hypothetical protein